VTLKLIGIGKSSSRSLIFRNLLLFNSQCSSDFEFYFSWITLPPFQGFVLSMMPGNSQHDVAEDLIVDHYYRSQAAAQYSGRR
jgi:hypothetical protein